jgi:hypothetical protein
MLGSPRGDGDNKVLESTSYGYIRAMKGISTLGLGSALPLIYDLPKQFGTMSMRRMAARTGGFGR